MSGSSVLEYARYYDLTIDAQSQNILGLIKCVPIQHEECHDLSREPSCPESDELLQDGKPQVSREAFTLLTKCTKPPPAPDWGSVLKEPDQAQRLKVDMPMVISDHARDMKWFKKGVDLHKLLQNCKETSKLKSPDIDRLPDIFEGCDRNAKAIKTEIKNERVEISIDVLMILDDCSHDTWRDQEMEDVISRDLKASNPRILEPLTPLLTPTVLTEEDVLPSLPPLPQLDLEPRSECSLEADDLLAQVERVSKGEDQVYTSDVDAGSPNTVRATLKEVSIPAPIDPVHFSAAQLSAAQPSVFEPTPKADQGFTSHDLKVVIPMVFSPPQSEQRTKCGKQVAFKDMFEEFINFPSQDESKDRAIPKEEDHDQKLLMQRLEQYEADVTEEIMTAKPEINDKALRVQVPRLESVGLIDPRAESTAANSFIQKLQETRIKAIKTKQADETRLNWVPIPQKLTQIDLKEHVEAPGSIDQLIEKPDKILRSEQLLYKEPGLRLLEVDDEDDEVMEEDAELAQTLTADVPENIIPQKRYIEELTSLGSAVGEPLSPKIPSCNAFPKPVRDADTISIQVSTKAGNCNDLLPRLPSSSVPQWQPQAQLPANQKGVEDLPEPRSRPKKKMRFTHCSPIQDVEASTGSFSAGGSLSSFLELRGSKFKKPILPDSVSRDGHDLFRGIEEIDTDPIVISQRGCPSRGEACQPLARSGSLRRPNEHIEVPSTPDGERSVDFLVPLPKLTEVTGQRTVIVDSALVNDRQLLSFLERQGKHSLTIIYRDLHGKPNVILHPKTCIMYTTFQALTQRNLPGQMPKQCISTPQQVIRHLALEFEKIFVLITVSASLKASVSDGQMNTMADFSSFCASVGPGSPGMPVVPLWIPTEDTPADSIRENSLCSWTWSLISRHAFRNMTTPSSTGNEEYVGIIEEETLWEAFLRRAGMNAMAAQVILGRLKRPEGGPDGTTARALSESERTWGLGKFVSMRSEERLKLFGGLVGIGAITRVNGALDSILK